jgi:hypothetical protein
VRVVRAELEDFGIRLNESGGRPAFGNVSVGEHDDLVVALGLATLDDGSRMPVYTPHYESDPDKIPLASPRNNLFRGFDGPFRVGPS